MHRPSEERPCALWQKHSILERNSILLLIGIVIVIAIGGLVEIVPLFYLNNTIERSAASAPTRRSSSPAATSTCAKAAISAIRR